MMRIILILVVFSASVFAQSGKKDSLLNIARKGNGKESIDALNALAFELKSKNPDSAIYYASLALQFSEAIQYDLGEAESNLASGTAQFNLGNTVDAEKILVFALNEFQKLNAEGKVELKRVKKDIGDAYTTLGNIYYSKGEYLLSLSCHQNSLGIRKSIQDQAGIATSYNNIALIFTLQGNYSEALKNHFASLKIKENLNNKRGMAISYNNIGLIFRDQGKDQEALEYLDRSLQLAKQEGLTNIIATCYVNIGAIYADRRKYELSLKYLNLSLDLSKKENNLENISNALGNIGEVLSKQGNYKEALEKEFEAIKIKQVIGDQLGESTFLIDVSTTYYRMGDITLATKYGEKALTLSEKIEAAKQIQEASKVLVDCYRKKGDFKKALEMQTLSLTIHDSILSKANSQELIKQDLKYAYEKKALADSLNFENQKKIAEISNKEELKIEENKQITLYIILALVVLSALFILNRFSYIKKQKNIIESQSKNLEVTHVELEERAREIRESILYSKEIQNAFLKSPTNSENYFKDTVLLYRPKDVVSGDFYWYKEIGDDMYVAVGDSTGHGVPGAIISVLAIQSLEKTIHKITNNGVLHRLNEYMKQEFNVYYNDKDHVSIGLDYSIICISKSLKKLFVSGSGSTVLVKDVNNKLETNKFDNLNIGGSTPASYEPSTVTYDLKQVQSVFLYTDGIVDQKGKETGKKFGSKKLKNMIMNLNTKDAGTAKEKMDKELDDWMQDGTQIDDITLLGIQIHQELNEIVHIEQFLKQNSSIGKPIYIKEFNKVINHEELNVYLPEAKEILSKFGIPKAISKKCYAIMVEALENGIKHGSPEEHYKRVFHKFEIGKESIELSFGNFISEKDIPNLKKHLDIIEKEDQEKIKELMFIKAADGAGLSEKGGAGVGIFDMALQSEGNIKHELFKVNTRFYYFTLIKINYGKFSNTVNS